MREITRTKDVGWVICKSCIPIEGVSGWSIASTFAVILPLGIEKDRISIIAKAIGNGMLWCPNNG